MGLEKSRIQMKVLLLPIAYLLEGIKPIFMKLKEEMEKNRM